MRYVLILSATAFLALAGGGWAHDSASNAPCSAPKVSVNTGTGVATAIGGGCKMRKKEVAKKFTYQYTVSDQGGNTCGTSPTRGVGRSFTLSAKPYGLKVRFGVSAQATPARIAWGPWRNFVLRGTDHHCAELAKTTLPPAGSLCEWPEDYLSKLAPTTCGEPLPGACAWAGPPTKVGNTVSAGLIACPQPPCEYGYEPKWEKQTWFNSIPVRAHIGLYCKDGNGVLVGAISVRLAHREGGSLVVDCVANTDTAAVTTFDVPSTWGGVLMVSFALKPFVGNKPGRTYVAVTKTFPLNGTQNGCADLKIPKINP
jgi:hypothetical protein